MLIVLQTFVNESYNMPSVGALIDPPEPVRSHLISIGVAAEYETKVDPLPEVMKKKQPVKSSASSRPVRQQRNPTRKSSKKSAKK